MHLHILPSLPEKLEKGVATIVTARQGEYLTEISDAEFSRYESLLDETERQRASAYRFEHLRKDFVFGRALLRTLLSRYVDDRPHDILFSYGKHGKPCLHDKYGRTGPSFSVSNTTGMLAIALTATGRIGIDMEHIDARKTGRDLAEHSLASNELAEYDAAGKDGPRLFFHYWCRKEAYLKAEGCGLIDNLSSIDVNGHVVRHTGRETGFLCHSLDPFPGYCMAFAHERQKSAIHTFQLFNADS